MNRKRMLILAALALLAVPCSMARAGVRIRFNIGIPLFWPAPRVYVAPPPPPVYYVQPAPVYAPAPVRQPVYQVPVQPAPVAPQVSQYYYVPQPVIVR